MGKNKARNKNKAKQSKKPSNENVAPKPQTTPPTAPEKNTTQTAFSANDSSARKRTPVAVDGTAPPSSPPPREQQPPAKDPTQEDATTHMSKVKRDSVISTATSAPPQPTALAAAPVKPPPRRRRLGTRLWRWLRTCWPYRFVRWTYHFFLALARVNWNDQQKFVDGVLTLGLVGLVGFASYIVLEFFMRRGG